MPAEWFGAKPTEPAAPTDPMVGAALDADGVTTVSLSDARAGVLAYQLALASGDDSAIARVWGSTGSDDAVVLRKAMMHLASGVIRPVLSALDEGPAESIKRSLRERLMAFKFLAE